MPASNLTTEHVAVAIRKTIVTDTDHKPIEAVISYGWLEIERLLRITQTLRAAPARQLTSRRPTFSSGYGVPVADGSSTTSSVEDGSSVGTGVGSAAGCSSAAGASVAGSGEEVASETPSPTSVTLRAGM